MSREIPIAGSEGNVWVPEDSLSPEDRSLVAEHRNALTAYQADGDPTHLTPYQGRVVGDVPLVTDPDVIDDHPDDYYIETFYSPEQGT